MQKSLLLGKRLLLGTIYRWTGGLERLWIGCLIRSFLFFCEKTNHVGKRRTKIWKIQRKKIIYIEIFLCYFISLYHMRKEG